MPSTIHSSPVFRWHHRVLGVLWGLCGLAEIGNVIRRGFWDEYQQWIGLFVALAYFVTGIGFIFGRTWARRIMGVLMAFALLLFLDMILMALFKGNRQLLLEMMLAAGIAGYTLFFLAVSAAWRQEGSR